MNLFSNIPEKLPREIIETIFDYDKIRIERIVSDGHISPKDFWYYQDENEWVIVLQGNAEIVFKDRIVKLTKGDYLNIPAHEKHRVEKTSNVEKTIWLAVFY
ncbi:MAG: cupin domain-containing protein [Candidatus Cloacimonetes bacterium]|nr:cupin domain-containing protein [Candidatus Cloacimonadota bacterium]